MEDFNNASKLKSSVWRPLSSCNVYRLLCDLAHPSYQFLSSISYSSTYSYDYDLIVAVVQHPHKCNRTARDWSGRIQRRKPNLARGVSSLFWDLSTIPICSSALFWAVSTFRWRFTSSLNENFPFSKDNQISKLNQQVNLELQLGRKFYSFCIVSEMILLSLHSMISRANALRVCETDSGIFCCHKSFLWTQLS